MRKDECQWARNLSHHDDVPQNSIQFYKVVDMWTINFMRPFPNSIGNKYILVVVEYEPKWVGAQALPTNDARTMVRFLRRLFKRFSTPRVIISDREGYNFVTCNLRKS